MDPSIAQQHQEMGSQTLESMLVCTKAQQEKKPRPLEQALKCPRCESTNTKFCYYNNYSLTQPRYFCKSCRRYWTKGGTLRNVPVGGGCRKAKRSSSSKRTQDQPMITTNHNPLSNFPSLSYDSTDLSLAFSRLQNQATGELGFDHDHDLSMLGKYPNNPHFDVVGNNFFNTSGHGFHNVYCGMGNGDVGRVENGGVGVKQESYNGGREGENRVLWGFPWQIGGDGNMMGEVDSGRQIWNGIGSSWHGLLNGTLM